jgi:O-phosphoseryl-tRNA(Cys) synthetase
MYLDLSICSRCQGTDDTLDAAMAETSAILKAAGVEVTVNKIHVASEEQARQLQFASSPTIRVNGRDIQMEVRESLCESCGDLCGDDVDCRVWVYQGKEYTVPPKAMIIDAVLSEVYGNAGVSVEPVGNFTVPDNLKRFFQSMQQKN